MGKEHPELPGFYYDPERKRYFALKRSIPGTRPLKVVAPTADAIPSKQGNKSSRMLGNLLAGRELNGKFIGSSCRSSTSELLNLYMTSPRVWKYRDTQITADTCLNHVSMYTETPTDGLPSPFLLTASSTGTLSIFQIGAGHDPAMTYTPEYINPKIEGQPADPGPEISPASLFHTESWQLSSQISCIKLHRRNENSTGSTNCHALITTMGSAACGGSLCILKSDSSFMYLPNVGIRQSFTFDGTCWTSEFNRDGSKAVIGTNRGAVLVDLETGSTSWMMESKSDIFSQQRDLSGNVILCGLRNGLILKLDLREKFRKHDIDFEKCRTYWKRNANGTNKFFRLNGRIQSSGIVAMPSSVCSLVTLMSDDRYFLASSMNGLIALYDNRMTRNCPVQTYDDHVNSHSMLQLAVDESERFVISGGEDKYLRLWNIKSGELLLEKNHWDSAPMTSSWETSYNCGSVGPNYAAWFGSREGIYRLQWR